ncbi:MAG: Bug family tripartite tricarboxylate transporter substrate binding protein [Syntrophales bacterium]
MKEKARSGRGEVRREFGGGRGRRVTTARRAPAITALFALAFLLVGITAAPLHAQAYPNKPIRFIFPFPPGGPTDILGRLIGQKLADRLGQPVVPENKPGAGANIGLEIGAKAKPDGYTITLASPSLAISPTLYKKLNYDSVKDFAPIALVAEIPNVLLVPSSSPLKSLRELIEYAKANPGKLNFGSGGIGTSNHLASELLKNLAQIRIVHVPYKGSNQAMIGMMGGEVGMVVVGIPPSQAQIRAGKVRALAVLSEQRLPAFPNIPTAKEAGIENFEVTTWYGILAPAGTPRDIVTRLNAELTNIVAAADTREKMQTAGFEPLSSTPEKFAEFVKTEIVRWGKVIRDANISVE